MAIGRRTSVRLPRERSTLAIALALVTVVSALDNWGRTQEVWLDR